MIQKEPVPLRKNPVVLFLIIFGAIALVFCIAAVILTFVIGQSVYKTYSFSSYISQGNKYYAEGKYQDAISNYSQAIAINSKLVYPYMLRADAYAHLEDYSNMEQDFEMAIKLDPSSAEAYNNFCWYGSLLGKAKSVLSVCEKAVSLSPDAAYIRDSRGLARALTGDYQGAILDFQYFVDHPESGIDPNHVKERILWIASLKNGNNPFDANELHHLLNDDNRQIPPGDVQGTVRQVIVT